MASHEASGLFAFASIQASRWTRRQGTSSSAQGSQRHRSSCSCLGLFFLWRRQLEEVVLSYIFPAVGLLAAARRAQAARLLSASRPSLFLPTWCSARARNRIAASGALASACRTRLQDSAGCRVVLFLCCYAAARCKRCRD